MTLARISRYSKQNIAIKYCIASDQSCFFALLCFLYALALFLFSFQPDYTDKRLRPLARLARITARPPRVFIRTRNP